MSEPEDFLSRWSRRKREVDAAQDKPSESKSGALGAGDDAAPSADPEKTDAAAAPATKQQLDLASLPSLESITAQTDIRAFLQAGVPGDLARAALRRAWSADPAIRDFIGPADYAWDFTTAGSMPGFGPLGPEDHINTQRAIAQLFGDNPHIAADAAATTGTPPKQRPAPPAQESGVAPAVAPSNQTPADVAQQPAQNSFDESPPQLKDNIATQQNESTQEFSQIKISRHGGALPQ